MIKKIASFILWFALWLLLTWPPSIQDIAVGTIVSAVVLLMTMDILLDEKKEIRNPLRYLWFIQYVLVFLWECLKANADVAYRVVHPDLPIRPGTIKVKTNLVSDIGLTFLTSSISLTPGNTTVDVDKEKGCLYIHKLCIKDSDREKGTLPVVEKFEKILKKIFE